MKSAIEDVNQVIIRDVIRWDNEHVGVLGIALANVRHYRLQRVE